MAPQTFTTDHILDLDSEVAVWRLYYQGGRAHLYVNIVPDGWDPASDRMTRYGKRHSGQGEDNVTHGYVGQGRVIREIWGNDYPGGPATYRMGSEIEISDA